MVPGQENSVSAIEWRDDALWLLDQRALPVQEVWLEHQEVAAVVESIRAMVVRGAPAIGITAAYGVVLAARNRRNQDAYTWLACNKTKIEAAIAMLARGSARPRAPFDQITLSEDL